MDKIYYDAIKPGSFGGVSNLVKNQTLHRLRLKLGYNLKMPIHYISPLVLTLVDDEQ